MSAAHHARLTQQLEVPLIVFEHEPNHHAVHHIINVDIYDTIIDGEGKEYVAQESGQCSKHGQDTDFDDDHLEFEGLRRIDIESNSRTSNVLHSHKLLQFDTEYGAECDIGQSVKGSNHRGHVVFDEHQLSGLHFAEYNGMREIWRMPRVDAFQIVSVDQQREEMGQWAEKYQTPQCIQSPSFKLQGRVSEGCFEAPTDQRKVNAPIQGIGVIR